MYVFIRQLGQSSRQYTFDERANQRLGDLLRQHGISFTKAFCRGKTVSPETVLDNWFNERVIELR
jgi:hypothetical protein